MDREQYIKLIEKCIPDENIRNYIFNNDNKRVSSFLTNATSVPVYFSNLMNLMFQYLYGKYKQWKVRDKMIDDASNGINNFKRVINNFNSLYYSKNLTYELIEFTLMDVQIDSMSDGIIKSEMRLYNSIIANSRLPEYMYKAKIARHSYRNNKACTDLNSILEDFLDFIKMFPVLGNMKFIFTQIDDTYKRDYDTAQLESTNRLYNVSIEIDDPFAKSTDDDTEKIIALNYTFISENKKHFYVLEKLEFAEENVKSRVLSYNKTGSFTKNIKIKISNDKFDNYSKSNSCQETVFEFHIVSESSVDSVSIDLLNYDVKTLEEDAKKCIIRDFYSINYRYLKLLSIAISDVIGIKEKKLLIEKYHNKYPLIMKYNIHYDNDDYVQNNWDVIIAMLLIEEGASDTLKVLIRDIDSDIHSKVLHNLEMRLGQDKFKSKLILDNINIMYNKAIQEWNNDSFVNHSNVNRDVYNKLKQNYAAIKAEICATVIVSEVATALNCDDINSNLVRFPNSIRSKIQYVRTILDDEEDWNANLFNTLKLFQQTIKTLLCFYNGFFEYAKVKQQYEENSFDKNLSNESVVEYQKKANVLFKKAVHSESKELDDIKYDSAQILTERFEQLADDCIKDAEKLLVLKNCLGRSLLFEKKEFEYFEKFDEKEIKTYDDFKGFCNKVIDVFTYLQNGKCEHKPFSDGLIYPCIATFEYSSITKDRYNIDNFSMINASGVEVAVRVLSEFKYDLNEKYLCMYNPLRSTQKLNLWIEPIIINYKNLVITQFNFRKIDNYDDFDNIIELIYTADNIIYRDLFGNLDNARIVLKKLLFNSTSVFYKDNYFVMEKDGKIVGVSANFNSKVKWDKNIVYTEMLSANVEIPATFSKVSEYFEMVYNYTNVGVNICNVSVHKDYRRQGIGRYMVQNIISTAGANDVSLTVLADNKPAIGLYKKLGFFTIQEFEDYSGTEENILAYKMYRMSRII